MFSKLAPSLADVRANDQEALEPGATEVLADLFYEIGKDLLVQKDYAVAVQWLERAYEALALRDIDGMSTDAMELRCSVMHYLGEQLLFQ